jgi:hypothetical protein
MIVTLAEVHRSETGDVVPLALGANDIHPQPAGASVRPTRVISLKALARSIVRITVATFVCAIAGFLILWALVRQPVVRGLPFPGTARANPSLLREHVRFLTTEVRPRSADHPENLDRTADFLAAQFRRSGARVTEQPFDARGKSFRNVLASFGPEGSTLPVMVVGAHYDAFSDTGSLPGADDNASGTAGLLELARLLGIHPPQQPVLLVAYSTEEPPFFGSGSMGSAVHADALKASGRAVAGRRTMHWARSASRRKCRSSPGRSFPRPSRRRRR